MTPKTGELYSLGVNAYLDDNYIHLHGRRTINEVNLLWREWFDGLYADGATTGRLMVLHLHPWIMGQPWRIRHLDEVLGHICAQPRRVEGHRQRDHRLVQGAADWSLSPDRDARSRDTAISRQRERGDSAGRRTRRQ